MRCRSSMRQGPIYRTPQPSGETGSQVSHLAAQMPPEMQPPASTLGREVITISVFVLVEGRKRRDSNPRYLSARSLSRSSTQRSAMTTPAVWAGHRRRRDRSRALLIAGECNHKCNHCGCLHRNVRPPVAAVPAPHQRNNAFPSDYLYSPRLSLTSRITLAPVRSHLVSKVTVSTCFTAHNRHWA